MKVTIIYDNTSIRPDLQADWGFSALVETKERKILFDTGANGRILLSNMQKLKIDPKEIEDVFISHLHWDHIGGLRNFLQVNNKVRVWVPSELWYEVSMELLWKIKKAISDAGIEIPFTQIDIWIRSPLRIVHEK